MMHQKKIYPGLSTPFLEKRIGFVALILVLFLCLGIQSQAKSNYQKNPHVNYTVDKKGGDYIISFSFKDHTGSLHDIELSYPIDVTDKAIEEFGVPRSFLNPYKSTEEVERQRREQLSRGMFRLIDNTVKIDYNAVVNRYAPGYCKPIADMLLDILRRKNLDTRHHRIEIAMKFVQDIPYAIPDEFEGKKYTGGALCPPEIIIKGWGDCDSKTMLFAGIVSYLIPSDDILFVGIKDHMLTAIRNKDIPGGIAYAYKDEDYYIAETAGPGRVAFGEKGEHFQNKANVEPFLASYNPVPPATTNAESELKVSNLYYAIRMSNQCKVQTTFIIRYMDINGDWVFSDFIELDKKSLSDVFTTQQDYFFFYAFTDELNWKGNEKFIVGDTEYYFNKVTIPSGHSSDFTMNLNCP